MLNTPQQNIAQSLWEKNRTYWSDNKVTRSYHVFMGVQIRGVRRVRVRHCRTPSWSMGTSNHKSTRILQAWYISVRGTVDIGILKLKHVLQWKTRRHHDYASLRTECPNFYWIFSIFTDFVTEIFPFLTDFFWFLLNPCYPVLTDFFGFLKISSGLTGLTGNELVLVGSDQKR